MEGDANVNNWNYEWWKNTDGDFEPMDAQLTMSLVSALRNRKENDIVTVDGREYRIAFKSVSDSQFHHSRGRSFYFIEVETGDLIRISDHWTKTGDDHKRSGKFNCGGIGETRCRWTCLQANKIHVIETNYLSGRYASRVIGARISELSKREK